MDRPLSLPPPGPAHLERRHGRATLGEARAALQVHGDVKRARGARQTRRDCQHGGSQREREGDVQRVLERAVTKRQEGGRRARDGAR